MVVLFFRKEGTEEVRPEDLEPMLLSCFEKKLGQFETRTEGVLEALEGPRQDFIRACDELKVLEADPYTEDLYSFSIASLRNQKALYVKSVRRIAEEMRPRKSEKRTSYERRAEALAEMERAIGEMLKTNARFRTVMYSYSNYMGTLKRSFAGMEKIRENLRREIGSREKEADEYRKVRKGIEGFMYKIGEKRAFGAREVALSEAVGRSGVLDDLEAGLRKNYDKKSEELRGVESRVDAIKAGINALTAPLGRAARKHDHLSLKKLTLSEFIEDPIERIRSEADCLEFMTMVGELKENIESDAIDAKNKERLIEAVSALLDSDIYGSISSLRTLQDKTAGLRREARKAEIELSELDMRKKAMEKERKGISELRQGREAVETAIGAAKTEIEKLFFEYYRKRISIVLE